MEPQKIIVGLDGEELEVLAYAVDEARRRECDFDTLEDPTTEDLLEASRHARLVVIGAGPSRWRDAGVSPAQYVAVHAACPVVVVSPEDSVEPRPGGVVVAIDDFDACEGPMRYAVRAAAERGETLQVVHGEGVMSDYVGREALRARREDALDAWREQHPDVRILLSVDAGHVVECCVDAARDAALLVVGQPAGPRVHHDSRSVAARVLRRSRTPVAVVPLDWTGEEVIEEMESASAPRPRSAS